MAAFPLSIRLKRSLFVAFFVLVNLGLHGVDAVGHGFLEGVGLLAVEEGLSWQVERDFGNLVVVAFGFVDFQGHFAFGGVVDEAVELGDFLFDELIQFAVGLEFNGINCCVHNLPPWLHHKAP